MVPRRVLCVRLDVWRVVAATLTMIMEWSLRVQPGSMAVIRPQLAEKVLRGAMRLGAATYPATWVACYVGAAVVESSTGVLCYCCVCDRV